MRPELNRTSPRGKMDAVLELYRHQPRSTRAFLRGRVLLSDMEAIEAHVPGTGTVLDLGCGHGLFANLLALTSPERRVIGIDLSPEKIAIAGSTVGARRGIEFICGDITRMPLPECDAITIVDVLYLMPRQEQGRLLGACHRLLKPGGVLVWKAQERRPAWKFAWTYLQELVSIRLGFTRGKQGKLCFLSREEALALLEENGYDPRFFPMKTRLPYTDIIYTGRRPEAS